MPPQPPVRLPPQPARPRLGEVRLRMNEPDDSRRRHAPPRAVHEAAVEIRLRTREQRPVDRCCPGARSSPPPTPARRGTARPRRPARRSRRSRTTADRRLVRQPEPRVVLGQHEVVVPVRPHPRRVADLQVEPAPLREHRREVELPVEEALLLGDPLADPQPRVRRRAPRPTGFICAKATSLCSASSSSAQVRSRRTCPRPCCASVRLIVPSSASSAPIHCSRVGRPTRGR